VSQKQIENRQSLSGSDMEVVVRWNLCLEAKEIIMLYAFVQRRLELPVQCFATADSTPDSPSWLESAKHYEHLVWSIAFFSYAYAVH
jgi:hypothetical protein